MIHHGKTQRSPECSRNTEKLQEIVTKKSIFLMMPHLVALLHGYQCVR